jgi:hypothetical protein
MDQVQKHICGRCNDEWLTEAEYVAHVCPATNVTPADPAHLGADFLEIQKAALERGKDRLEEPAAIERQEAAIAEVEQAIAEPVQETPAPSDDEPIVE